MNHIALPLPERSNTVPGVPLKSKLKFRGPDGFQKYLKSRIERYFQYTRRTPRDVPAMYLKSAIILAWFFGSYAFLVFAAANWWQGVLGSLSLGVAMAAIGFNIQHDANHKAYSDHPWINRMMAYTLDLLGGSSFLWDHKHNTVHHTYSNITGHDDDIEIGPLGRLSPHQPRHFFHRFQHYYLWLLYGFIAIKWQLVDDYRDMIRGRIGHHKFSRPKNWHLVAFIAGKATALSLAFVIPWLWGHPIWQVILFYVLACWLNGLLIATVFQLAHVVEEADFPIPDDANTIHNHWAIHQVATTVDFSRKNPIVTWFMGGLNFQIEHHLFPKISHIHYPKISRLTERACKRFNIPYHTHKSFFHGVASHFRWLRHLGQPQTA